MGLYEELLGPRPPFVSYFCARCGTPVREHNCDEKCQCGEFGAQHVRPVEPPRSNRDCSSHGTDVVDGSLWCAGHASDVSREDAPFRGGDL